MGAIGVPFDAVVMCNITLDGISYSYKAGTYTSVLNSLRDSSIPFILFILKTEITQRVGFYLADVFSADENGNIVCIVGNRTFSLKPDGTIEIVEDGPEPT